MEKKRAGAFFLSFFPILAHSRVHSLLLESDQKQLEHATRLRFAAISNLFSWTVEHFGWKSE